MTGCADQPLLYRLRWRIARLSEQWLVNRVDPRPELPVEEVPARSLADWEIHDFSRPLVARGFMADAAIAKWNLRSMAQRFGDAQVLIWNGMTTSTTPDNFLETGAEYVPFRKFLQELGEHKTTAYINNYDMLFLAYKAELNTPAMRRAMGGSLVGGQLFIGANATGTAFHCAMYHNLFVQIAGRKRWCFVPPHQTHFIRARVSNNVEVPYGISMLDVDKNPGVWARLERYCTVLERGDVLLAPSWHWHRVENLAPVNMGSSSRWVVNRIGGIVADFANHPAMSILFPFDVMLFVSRLFGYDPKVGPNSFFPIGESLWTDWIIEGSRLQNPEWKVEDAVSAATLRDARDPESADVFLL